MTFQRPSLKKVLEQAFEEELGRLHVCMPGRIESFDAATQTADVQPSLKETYVDIDGETRTATPPIITGVPVQFPRGGAFSLTMPIAKGDSCLLVFADRSLDNWAFGGDEPTDDPRQHSFSDAICIPGVGNLGDALPDWDEAALQLGATTGPKVRLTTSQVHLGVGAGQAGAQSVLRGTAYRTAEDALFDNLFAVVAQVGAAVVVLQNAAAPGSGAALTKSLKDLVTSFATFKAQQFDYLSQTVKLP